MASYRIAVDIAPGVSFAIVAESVDELLTEYAQVKGNTDWLTEQIMEMVPASERGEGVGALQAAVSAELATESEQAPDEPESVREVKDPWSGKVVSEPARRRSAARSEPSEGTSADGGGSSRPDTNVRRERDRFGNQWVGGLPEAPNCTGHDLPAARFTGKSRAGKEYTVYRCPLGAPWSDQWRDKCDFSEFPD